MRADRESWFNRRLRLLSGLPDAALAASRRLFIQCSPRFTRFEAKAFLLDAVRFMAGVCPVCIIDNTSVLLAAGAGADAVIAPEMAAPWACGCAPTGWEIPTARAGSSGHSRMSKPISWPAAASRISPTSTARRWPGGATSPTASPRQRSACRPMPPTSSSSRTSCRCPPRTRPRLSPRAGAPGVAVLARQLPVRPPARRQPRADPDARRAGLPAPRRQRAAHRQARHRENRIGHRTVARGLPQRLPWPLHQRSSSAR